MKITKLIVHLRTIWTGYKSPTYAEHMHTHTHSHTHTHTHRPVLLTLLNIFCPFNNSHYVIAAVVEFDLNRIT